MKFKRFHRNGFTVLELLVVVLITMVLTLIAVESYSAFQKSRRIRAGAEAVNSVLLAARSYAITTNGYYRVVFQYKNPATDQEDFAFWVDEVYSSEVENLNPNGRMDYQLLPAAKRAKLVPPQNLLSGLRFDTIYFGTLGYNTTPPIAWNYIVVYFRPDGQAADMSIQLRNTSTNPDATEDFYTVQLYGATGKSKIFPYQKRQYV